MEKDRIIQTAQAVVNQKVSNYNATGNIGPLLQDLQRTLTVFCNSFCDWLIMGENRFRLDVDAEGDYVQINVILMFPLEGDIDVEFTTEVSDE